jgi:hypothetical protein
MTSRWHCGSRPIARWIEGRWSAAGVVLFYAILASSPLSGPCLISICRANRLLFSEAVISPPKTRKKNPLRPRMAWRMVSPCGAWLNFEIAQASNLFSLVGSEDD